MHIRRALISEASTIAMVGTRAFGKDPSYGHFYPWRDHFPEDFYMHLHRKYLRLMATPACCIMAVVLDDGDITGKESSSERAGTIVGFATFQRSGGTQEQHDKWGEDTPQKRLVRQILDLQEATEAPNRAVSQEALDDFWKQELVSHNSTEYTDKIDFYTLAILPEYQRHGVGARLLYWGVMRAVEEGVPGFGDASSKGIALYTRLGGKVIGNIVQEETTYTRNWCGNELPSVHAPRLETPVLRWDAANLSWETLQKYISHAARDSKL